MEKQTITMDIRTLQKELSHDGRKLLTYRIDYPHFQGERCEMALALMNAYYLTRAKSYQRYLERELFPQAVEQYANALEHGYPVMVYEALVKYSLTLKNRCIASLYSDQYEFTGGAHGNTIRSAETWNLQKCCRVKLRDLVGCGEDSKEILFPLLEEQIARSPEIYFDDYKTLLRKTFDENSFYCTPQGMVIYYQQYDIAPYSSGIRTFLLPYGECIRPPQTTCFHA